MSNQAIGGMQQASLSQSKVLPFSGFLTALFQAFENEGLQPCILRNYEGFPVHNVGGDIDFLVRPSELPRAIRALRSIQGIRVVGYTERPYVASVYLAGTAADSGGRSLQVDFDLSLSWKGLPYLPIDAVLRAMIPVRTGHLNFFVPSPVDEAITSLLTSLLAAGCLKEKYFTRVQQTFAADRLGAIAALRQQFGLKASSRLVDSVIESDRGKVLACVGPLRRALALRSLLRTPVRSVLDISRHYGREFAIRFSPRSLETVSIIGSDACGGTNVVEGLMPLLQSAAKFVERRDLGVEWSFGRERSGNGSYSNSGGAASRGPLTYVTKVIPYLVKEWLDRFSGRKNLTLRIYEGYYHVGVVDPGRYRYKGPTWFAVVIGSLIPSPDLWILLDLPTDAVQSRNLLTAAANAHAHAEARRAFVKTRRRFAILDANHSSSCVLEGAYCAIIDMLAERAERQLESRFQ